jgi:hypothetical protein
MTDPHIKSLWNEIMSRPIGETIAHEICHSLLAFAIPHTTAHRPIPHLLANSPGVDRRGPPARLLTADGPQTGSPDHRCYPRRASNWSIGTPRCCQVSSHTFILAFDASADPVGRLTAASDDELLTVYVSPPDCADSLPQLASQRGPPRPGPVRWLHEPTQQHDDRPQQYEA